MVACAGPPATISCEPRQARKGAAAAVVSSAGVWLVQVTSIIRRLYSLALDKKAKIINELSGSCT